MLLRSSLMSSSYFSPVRAPDDGTGAADPPVVDEGDPPAASGDLPAVTGESDPPATPAVASEPKPDWRDRELGRKHRQNQDLKRALEDRERENADLRAIAERAAAAPPVEGDPPAAPAVKPAARPAAPAATEDAVRVEAAKLVAKENYDRDCDAAYTSGKKEFKDWDAALENIKLLGGIEFETMTGLLATDDPARVLHALGSNPDEYHRVMALPPAKRLNEMAKIATVPAPKKKPSEAPAPVDSLGGRGGGAPDDLDDKLTDVEWYARREAQKRKKWLESQGRGASA